MSKTTNQPFKVVKSEQYAGYKIRHIKIKSGMRYQVDFGRSSGKHPRPRFKKLQDARGHAQSKRNEVSRKGVGVLTFSEVQKSDAVEALQILKGFKANLRQAATFYVKHNQKVDETNEVSILVQMYLDARAADEDLSKRTIADEKRRLKLLSGNFSSRAIQTIDATEVDACLNERGIKGVNRKNYLAYFGGFFNWAIKRELLSENPIKKTVRVKIKEHIPEIYKPTEVKAVMEAVEALHQVQKEEKFKNKRSHSNSDFFTPLALRVQAGDSIVPYFAISFFAGIRPDEISQLKWEDVRFGSKNIFVSAEVSKTSTARYVSIQNNLMAWLNKYRRDEGLICPFSYSSLKRWRGGVYQSAGVKMIQDGARHTFATFNLALYGLDKTIHELGHTNTSMLYKHYKGLSENREADATEFFWINPKKAK